MDREGEVFTARCCRAVPASSRDREQECRYVIWGAFSEESESKRSWRMNHTGKRERDLQGPAFCCELEGHLFRGHLRERTPSDGKKHPGALLDFTAALACWIQNCLSLHKGFQLLNWWDGLFFFFLLSWFFLFPNISVSEFVAASSVWLVFSLLIFQHNPHSLRVFNGWYRFQTYSSWVLSRREACYEGKPLERGRAVLLPFSQTQLAAFAATHLTQGYPSGE